MQVRGRLGAVMSAQGSVLSLSVGRVWPARIERLECVLRKTGARLDAAAPRLTVVHGARAAAHYPPLRLLP